MKTKTDDLLALICKAATERYPEDRLAPGVQIAHVIEGSTAFWYVALHRYPKDIVAIAFEPQRKIVHKVKNEDLDVAIKELALLMLPKTEAVKDLAEAVGVKL
jgi:hypothetical protein